MASRCSKLAKVLGMLLFVYVLPLLGDSTPAQRPLLIAALIATTLILSQPDVTKREMLAARPTDHLSVFVLLVVGTLSLALPVLEWRLRHHPWPTGIQDIGVVVAIAGLALRIYAIRILGTLFSPVVRIHEKHELVMAGPYRALRHPSYTGAFLVICGHALILGAPVAAASVALAMGLAYRYRVRVEENALDSALGQKYRDYARRTRRMIPCIW